MTLRVRLLELQRVRVVIQPVTYNDHVDDEFITAKADEGSKTVEALHQGFDYNRLCYPLQAGCVA